MRSSDLKCYTNCTGAHAHVRAYYHSPLTAQHRSCTSELVALALTLALLTPLRPSFCYNSRFVIASCFCFGFLPSNPMSRCRVRAKFAQSSRKNSHMRVHRKFGLCCLVSKQLYDIINIVGHECPGKYKKECVCICVTKQTVTSVDSRLRSITK